VGTPVILHLTRPYANAEEYLEREAWSIDTRSMVLVGQVWLPPETDVAFDVTLADGSKPIRAEAKVVGVIPASDGRPGGLKVRFRRYGAATRAFVDRAASARSSNGEPPVTTPPPQSARPERASVRPPPRSVRPPTSVPPSQGAPSGASSSPPARPSGMPAWEEDKTSRFSRASALAAPMTHEPNDVSAPKNRDALLDRLRKRARETEGSGG
jgi:hypothetical protein